MKILGYVDDFISIIIQAQISAGWWNLLIIPVELLVLYYLVRLNKYCCMN